MRYLNFEEAIILIKNEPDPVARGVLKKCYEVLLFHYATPEGSSEHPDSDFDVRFFIKIINEAFPDRASVKEALENPANDIAAQEIW